MLTTWPLCPRWWLQPCFKYILLQVNLSSSVLSALIVEMRFRLPALMSANCLDRTSYSGGNVERIELAS